MWAAATVIGVGVLLVAAPIVVALRGDRSEDIAGVKGVLMMAAILSGIVLVGGGALYAIVESECSHAEVRWIASGTEFIPQRALDSRGDKELWLDATTGSGVLEGSGRENREDLDRIASFARSLAPLSDADRERVEEYAAQFLRSSSCD